MTQRIDLNGVWRYQPLAWTTVQADGSMTDNAENLPPAGEMALPMNWQLRGLESFDGRVRFTRRFAAPALANGARAFLVFRGVDYFADVTLNGQPVGKHAGYFQPFEFEITDLLRQGENQLQIDVDCPKEEPGAVWPDHKWIIKGILNHWDARPGSWELTTGQEQNSGGIWGEVYVETRGGRVEARVDGRQGLGPVHVGLALAEELQVRAREARDAEAPAGLVGLARRAGGAHGDPTPARRGSWARRSAGCTGRAPCSPRAASRARGSTGRPAFG